ncbi:MAG: hypothetical protein M5R36_02075 [Deltaproteobacteria bacterium]|nr:hypothetical protein [Deltaproteobacteria bacterium]
MRIAEAVEHRDRGDEVRGLRGVIDVERRPAGIKRGLRAEVDVHQNTGPGIRAVARGFRSDGDVADLDVPHDADVRSRRIDVEALDAKTLRVDEDSIGIQVKVARSGIAGEAAVGVFENEKPRAFESHVGDAVRGLKTALGKILCDRFDLRPAAEGVPRRDRLRQNVGEVGPRAFEGRGC